MGEELVSIQLLEYINNVARNYLLETKIEFLDTKYKVWLLHPLSQLVKVNFNLSNGLFYVESKFT